MCRRRAALPRLVNYRNVTLVKWKNQIHLRRRKPSLTIFSMIKHLEEKRPCILQVTSQFLVGWNSENTFPIGRTLNCDSLEDAFL